jgi:hypothetical protein
MLQGPTFDEKSFRYRVIGIFIAALGFIGADAYFIASDTIHRGQVLGRDFLQFWGASVLIGDGRFAELYDFETLNLFLDNLVEGDLATHGFFYPPHGLFLIWPLSWLPYVWSYALWSVGTLVAYLFAIGLPDWSRKRIFYALLAPATLLVIELGQNGLLSAALFLGGMRLLDRRPVLAGILIGLLSFKPHLGLLIPFALLAGRYWITFATASLTVAAMVGWSLAVGGIGLWSAYLGQDAMTAAVAFLERGTGATTSMMQSPFNAVHLLGLEASSAYVVQAIFAVLALGSVIWSFYRGADRTLQTATLATAIFLFSPYLLSYDMAILSGALIFMFEGFSRRGPRPRDQILFLAVWFLPLLGMYLNSWGLPIGPLLLLALLMLLIARQRSLLRA